MCWRVFRGCLPQAEPAKERIGVVAHSRTWRELLEFLGVASTDDYIVRL
jgi:hypothetical protein